MENYNTRIEELLELMESIDQDDRIWLEQEIAALTELNNETQKGASK